MKSPFEELFKNEKMKKFFGNLNEELKEIENMSTPEMLEKLENLRSEAHKMPDCKQKDIMLDLNLTTQEIALAHKKMQEANTKEEKQKHEREYHKCAMYGMFLLFQMADLKPEETIPHQAKPKRNVYEAYVKEDDNPWNLN
jgi:predicted transcriptional regulator